MSASYRKMVMVAGIAVMILTAAADGTQAVTKSMFARFIGVCQASADPKRPELWNNISFIRRDLSWARVQPDGRESWNQKYLDDWGEAVLRNRRQGVETLPMLGYMAPWAARRRAWSFTIGDTRYDVTAAKGTEPRKAVAVNLKTGKKKEMNFSPGILPPEDVKDWENFVERVVVFLSKPPYNVRYFQPWNEAHDRFTGFWVGGLDEYMKTIHLPAARIIRKHGCKVVYGGYPCCGTMQRLVEICNKYDVWKTLDILDIHYFPLSAWEYLYPRVVRPGKVRGLWQTEIGFTKSTDWVPNNYPRFFHWALRHDWQPDRYRIFQFAYWSPNDPKAYGYGKCLLLGDRPSCHGKALITLGRLLDSARIVPYEQWRTDPVLRTEVSENLSSVEGFDTGSRVVLAVHLVKQNAAPVFTDRAPTMQVHFPDIAPQNAKAAWRVGIYGSKLPLRIEPEPEGGGVRLTVPVCDGDPEERVDNRAARATTFYVVLER